MEPGLLLTNACQNHCKIVRLVCSIALPKNKCKTFKAVYQDQSIVLPITKLCSTVITSATIIA